VCSYIVDLVGRVLVGQTTLKLFSVAGPVDSASKNRDFASLWTQQAAAVSRSYRERSWRIGVGLALKMKQIKKLTDGVLAVGASSCRITGFLRQSSILSVSFLQTVILYPVVQLPFTRSAGPDSPIVAV
jgi:hypothetical protein